MCAHARLGPASLVLFDVSTLHFETDTADGFREPGFSKERRLNPQIVIGLLTDAAGFPLMVHAFEGNTAETKTMLPVITAFMAADQLTDVNVVADAGMISDANKRAIEAARLSFILGLRIPDLPCVVAQWRRHHPGQQIPDGHIFTQPWPAGPTDKRRDQVIYYQYRHDRARRALRGIDTQVAKAEKAVAGAAPVKRNRFISLSGGTRSVNRALEAKARAIAGLKGYVTGTVALSVHMIARWEIFLYDSCVRPQVDPFGYQRTPVGSICGPLAELGRRSCGADVAGWLNATVPGPVGVGGRVPDLPTAGDPHPAGRRDVSSALPHGPGRQPWGRSWGCSSPSGSWPAAGRPTCSARRSTPSGERTANRTATARATPVMTVPPSA
jgi:Transposase DDE domain